MTYEIAIRPYDRTPEGSIPIKKTFNAKSDLDAIIKKFFHGEIISTGKKAISELIEKKYLDASFLNATDDEIIAELCENEAASTDPSDEFIFYIKNLSTNETIYEYYDVEEWISSFFQGDYTVEDAKEFIDAGWDFEFLQDIVKESEEEEDTDNEYWSSKEDDPEEKLHYIDKAWSRKDQKIENFRKSLIKKRWPDYSDDKWNFRKQFLAEIGNYYGKDNSYKVQGNDELEMVISSALDQYGFDADLNFIDISGLRSLRKVFNTLGYFDEFKGDVSRWNTSNIQDMGSTFSSCKNFNGDLSNWDTSNVKWMDDMFSGASIFNQPIGNWDTSNVTTMNSMFMAAYAFNQDISNWDVSKVENMRDMFWNAESFKQDLSNWSILPTCNMIDFSGGYQGPRNDIYKNPIKVGKKYYGTFRESMTAVDFIYKDKLEERSKFSEDLKNLFK